jgi:hypothetical protein
VVPQHIGSGRDGLAEGGNSGKANSKSVHESCGISRNRTAKREVSVGSGIVGGTEQFGLEPVRPVETFRWRLKVAAPSTLGGLVGVQRRRDPTDSSRRVLTASTGTGTPASRENRQMLILESKRQFSVYFVAHMPNNKASLPAARNWSDGRFISLWRPSRVTIQERNCHLRATLDKLTENPL